MRVINLVKYRLFMLLAVLFAASALLIVGNVHADSNDTARNGRLITFHDRGDTKVIFTNARSVRDALKSANISVIDTDNVEPSLDEKLIATDYTVNIYRSRPVTVIDGSSAKKILTARQSAREIAKSADITLHDEDLVKLTQSTDILADGAGETLTIDRATEFQLTLYGKVMTAYSRSATVGEMLGSKGIKLASSDTLSVSKDTPLTAGLKIAVWRNGVQTLTVDEDIPFGVRQVWDYDRAVGYRQITTPGVNGKRAATYEIHMQNGKEISRKLIQSMVVMEPSEQVEVSGVKTTSPGENEAIAWRYLSNQGFSRNQVAGIMGNLMQEHGFRTDGDGLAQWTGSRKASLMSRADPYNIMTQLDFLMHELNGGYSKVKANLLAESTVEGSVRVFQNQFERCGNCVEVMRIKYAYGILERY